LFLLSYYFQMNVGSMVLTDFTPACRQAGRKPVASCDQNCGRISLLFKSIHTSLNKTNFVFPASFFRFSILWLMQ